MKIRLTAWVVLSFLVACSSSSNDNSGEADESHKALYDAVNQPLEKAKGVERQLLDNAEQQRKQLDSAE